jgi:hypothetical protein
VIVAPLMIALAINQSTPQAHAAAVLRKMVAVNAAVKSYKVRIHFNAKVHAFISLPLSLNATYYFKKPDKAQIVFDTIPALAKQFKEFYASTGTPATWPRDYEVTAQTPETDDPPDSVVLKLVPRQEGSLDYALITVDTATWGITVQRWLYHDGSSIVVNQFNETGGRYVLPGHQEADFSFPRYKAHVVADFADYKINVPISDSIFKK